jgi:heme oxygenase (biliverdin-IX-beta and delta-forming)
MATQTPMASPRVPSDVLYRLRTESRPEHDAIERALDLTDSTLTLAAYRLRIEQFYGFYAPIEDRLGALGAFAAPGTGPERKAPLLLADLLVLGVAAPSLPQCQALPDLTGAAEMLGCLYVLEGATLGGQVIARRLRDTLGIGPASGASFFHGHGEETGARWRAFTAVLAASGRDEVHQDAMVRSAIGTFRALRLWCEARPTP